MHIQLKLFASLGDYLPSQQRDGNQVQLTLPEGSTLTEVIERFALPPQLVHLVLVNGRYIEPDQRPTHALQEGDALAIWPPIAGG